MSNLVISNAKYSAYKIWIWNNMTMAFDLCPVFTEMLYSCENMAEVVEAVHEMMPEGFTKNHPVIKTVLIREVIPEVLEYFGIHNQALLDEPDNFFREHVLSRV